jgi:hypothetical protein
LIHFLLLELKMAPAAMSCSLRFLRDASAEDVLDDASLYWSGPGEPASRPGRLSESDAYMSKEPSSLVAYEDSLRRLVRSAGPARRWDRLEEGDAAAMQRCSTPSMMSMIPAPPMRCRMPKRAVDVAYMYSTFTMLSNRFEYDMSQS